MARRKSKPAEHAAEPEMKKFTCQGCGFQGFDVQEYFSGRPSTRCLWCVKYPKPKKAVAEAKQINASDAAEKA